MDSQAAFARIWPRFQGKSLAQHCAELGGDINDVPEKYAYLLQDRQKPFNTFGVSDQMHKAGMISRNINRPPTLAEKKRCGIDVPVPVRRARTIPEPVVVPPPAPRQSATGAQQFPTSYIRKRKAPAQQLNNYGPSSNNVHKKAKGPTTPPGESSSPASLEPKEREATGMGPSSSGFTPINAPQQLIGALTPAGSPSGFTPINAPQQSIGALTPAGSPSGKSPNATKKKATNKDHPERCLHEFNLVEGEYAGLSTPTPAGKIEGPVFKLNKGIPSWKWICWQLLAREPAGAPMPMAALHQLGMEWIPALKGTPNQTVRSALIARQDTPFYNLVDVAIVHGSLISKLWEHLQPCTFSLQKDPLSCYTAHYQLPNNIANAIQHHPDSVAPHCLQLSVLADNGEPQSSPHRHGKRLWSPKLPLIFYPVQYSA